MITTKPTIHEKTQTLQGPAGLLEAHVGEPKQDPRSAWGIVCHPHPLYGGNMNNKIVTTLVKVFQEMGCHTVRFNFRGVGHSQGSFDNGVGELEDLLAVVSWVQQQHPKKELWLGGFSFGACIAAKAATQIPVAKLVTVAPAVENVPMRFLAPIKSQWVLVQGEKDEVVSPQAVFEWAQERDPPPTIIRFPNAGHFFHGELTELRQQLIHAL